MQSIIAVDSGARPLIGGPPPIAAANLDAKVTRDEPSDTEEPPAQAARPSGSCGLADNRLPEQAVWDFDLLRGHFRNLIELDFDVELTGFSTGEIDLLIDGSQQSMGADPADDLAGLASEGPAISQSGDVWELGRHRLACGDSQRTETYERLLQGELAEMMVTDPPYNVLIDGHAMGRGSVRHRE